MPNYNDPTRNKLIQNPLEPIKMNIKEQLIQSHNESIKNNNKEQLIQNILKDKTNEITNAGIRKNSLLNKEPQEFSSQTQRNICKNNTDEHIYSSIINIMSVKKTNNMKGFFSGLGKNYKTFNDSSKNGNVGVGNNKPHLINGHFENRNATVHVPITQSRDK